MGIPDIGFIILRHVNSEDTNRYWIHCYNCIRKFYPANKIVIIDDNSNYTYVTKHDMTNTTIIQSEYPGRGELLPYYYYSRNKWFDTAVILHDSVFINKYIDFSVDTYRMLWTFLDHQYENKVRGTYILNKLNEPEILKIYLNPDIWSGCFGVMASIRHTHLKYINSMHNIKKLLLFMNTKEDRCILERIMACVLQLHGKTKPFLGDIHKYCPWGIRYEQKDAYVNDLPVIKVWAGR